jgi:hypothetical protein
MPQIPSFSDRGDLAIAQWVGETGTGVGVNMAAWPDKSIIASGTGTVTVQGSADGTNWFPLRNATGSPAAVSLVLGTNNVDTILDNTPLIRVINTAGTATITITGVKN